MMRAVLSPRGPVRALLAALLVVLGLAPRPAQADSSEVRRYALFIGANDGGSGRAKLRYASSDAENFASVLEQLGGVPAGRRVVLSNPTPTALRAGFAELKEIIRRESAGALRSEFLLYYSGHSDETGILLGGSLVEYSELRSMVDDLSVDVKLAVLDSCASGAITRQKGGTHRAPFLVDESVQVRGQAFLTSSSADEVAQESDRLSASFFTHYLVSGLRGAADVNTDGKITLNEVYQFAYAETLARTQKTAGGAQHPAYDIDLVGTGDLVMTDLRNTTAKLFLASELSGRVFVKSAEGRIVVELMKNPGQPVELGLAPGSYQVTLSGKKTYSADVQLKAGSPVALEPASFAEVSREGTRARGDAPAVVEAPVLGPLSAPHLALVCCGHWRQQPDFVGLGLVSNLYGLRGADIELGASLSSGDVSGLQLGLGASVSRGTLRGLQVSAGLNAARDIPNGAQVAGMMNLSRGSLRGAQIAGVINVNGLRDVPEEIIDPSTGLSRPATLGEGFAPGLGLQVAGIGNISGSVRGVQTSGLFNLAGGPFEGVQVTGGSNVARGGFLGLQASGALNLTTGSFRGAQISGLLNIAGGSQAQPLLPRIGEEYGVQGAQIAVLNIAGDVRGAQIGVINIAHKVKGSQIGVVNLANEVDGLPLGVISIIREGQHNLSLWSSDINPLNVGFQTGGRSWYTLFSGGVNPGGEKTLTSFGLGVGVKHNFTKRLYAESDLSASSFLLIDSIAQNVRFVSSNLYTLRVNAGFSLLSHLSIFGGPTFHLLHSYNGSSLDIGADTFVENVGGGSTLVAAPGFSLGLKF